MAPQESKNPEIGTTSPTAVPSGYDLTPEETQFFLAVNQAAMNAKLAICNLNMELEKAHAALKLAEGQFGGSVALLATSKKLAAPAALNESFTRIETVKG
jgi:hypothetical protein